LADSERQMGSAGKSAVVVGSGEFSARRRGVVVAGLTGGRRRGISRRLRIVLPVPGRVVNLWARLCHTVDGTGRKAPSYGPRRCTPECLAL